MTDILLLIITLLLPILLAFIVVKAFLGVGDNLKSKAISCFKLNTDYGLAKQGILWLAILLPLFLGLSFGFWAWIDYQVNLSVDGFKKFIEISLLPLAIISISLPLAGLVSKFHSTSQAAKQISITRLKNNLDAFAGHRKGMLDYFSVFEEIKYFDEYEFDFKAHPVLHKRFFTGSPENGWPSLDEDSFDEVERRINSAARFLTRVLSGDSDRRLDDYMNASLNIFLAAQGLHIKKIFHDMVRCGVFIKYKGESSGVSTVGRGTLETLAALRFVREFYNNFCDFSGRSRMLLDQGLEDVFLKTEYWMKRGDVIEAINNNEIEDLVKCGAAEYCEKHKKYINNKDLLSTKISAEIEGQ